MKFKLHDQNSDSYKGEINLDFNSIDDFLDWTYPNDKFEKFMDHMETGHEDYCGVHDGGDDIEDDGEEIWMYSSYEIKNFEKAIEKWEEFFRINGKIK
jgi:hypothetical protein